MAASVEAGLKKTTDDLLKNGNLTGTQAFELEVVKKHFESQVKEKAAKALEKLVEEATAFGSPLSKAYMTGLVV
jgi:chromosome segregation and condensation protein ScpB